MVLIIGSDWELIGWVQLVDLGLEKCSNCNAKKPFGVQAHVSVSKILAWQVGAKFGLTKGTWIFMVTCPTCEKGYQFVQEKGRDQVQQLMLKSHSLYYNIWYNFMNTHALFNHKENLKERARIVKNSRKEAPRILKDLSKLGMHELVRKIVAGKDTHPKSLKKTMEAYSHLGFDIEL